MKLWLDKGLKIQCLETFEVMIIVNYKTLKYSPSIAPVKLSDRCWDVWRHMLNMICTSRRCPMTSHDISHISVPVLASSLQLFLLLHYHRAKCLIYCLSLNLRMVLFWWKNAAIKEIKESVALFSCVHCGMFGVSRGNKCRPCYRSGGFNIWKCGFFAFSLTPILCIYKQKNSVFRIGFISPFEWCKIPSHLYTLNSL